MVKRIYLLVGVMFCMQWIQAQIGVGTSSPNSDLHIAGATALAIRSATANESITISDQVMIFTGTSAASFTLPDATASLGRIYWIKNASTLLPAPSLTVLTSSSQTIDGQSSWLLDEPNEVIRIASDGSNWQVFSQNVTVRKTSTVGAPWLKGGNKLKSMKAFGSIENYGFSFITNNTVKMHLTNAGLLGWGTSAPLGRIHSITENDDLANDYYFDDHNSTLTQGFFIRKARGTIIIPSDLQNGDIIGQLRFAGRYNASLTRNAGSGFDSYYTGNGSSVSTDLRVFSSNSERMRVNQNGQVGIGTSSFDATNPEKLLVDAGSTSSHNLISGRGEIDSYLQLNVRNSNNGTSASSDIVATADNGNESVNFIDLGINSNGYTNTSLPILGGINTTYLFGLGNEMKIGNAAAYDLSFFTNGFALSNERMRITASGNVGIGAGVPDDKLSVGGIMSPGTDNTYTIGKSGARWSEVYATNGTIQTSDLRLKKNIKPINYGINTILQIDPIRFVWKATNDSTQHLGIIAQQIQHLIPEIVENQSNSEMLGVNYSELVPVLILALQEQQQQLKKLQSKLKSLNR